MIFALAKMSALYEPFNRRGLTEEDGFFLAEREGVTISFEDMPTLQGFHIKMNGRLFICLDMNLKGLELLFIFLHELAHALLHETKDSVAVHFYHQFDNRFEDEAEAVALVAMFPTCCLQDLINQLTDEDCFLNILIERRLIIFERFGI